MGTALQVAALFAHERSASAVAGVMPAKAGIRSLRRFDRHVQGWRDASV
jgi:hypothetical protein